MYAFHVYKKLYQERIYISQKLFTLETFLISTCKYIWNRILFYQIYFFCMHQKCKVQFVDVMNITIITYQKYIYWLKANNISFWSMYIYLIYNDGNIYCVKKLYNLINLMIFIIIKNTLLFVVHWKYIHWYKANNIRFWSMYIFLIYDNRNIHRVVKLYHLINLIIFIIIETTL